MTPETANLVRKRLTSEYFLACFLKGPASGYALGQIVQNKKRPNTKTLHTATTALKNAGFIKRDFKSDGDHDGKFCINSEKLVNTIEEEFLRKKRVMLSAEEKKILAGILESKGPFVLTSDQMISNIHRQKFRFHNIDALELICDTLGSFAAGFLVMRKTVPDNYKEKISIEKSQETFDGLNSIWDQVGPKLDTSMNWLKEESGKRKGYTKKFPYAKSFEQLPDNEAIREGLDNALKTQKALRQKREKTESDKKSVLLLRQTTDYIQAVLNALPATKTFAELPEETLLKICLLWNQGDGFLIAWNALSKKQNGQ